MTHAPSAKRHVCMGHLRNVTPHNTEQAFLSTHWADEETERDDPKSHSQSARCQQESPLQVLGIEALPGSGGSSPAIAPYHPLV